MSTPDPLITAADTVDGNDTEAHITETFLEALKARTSRVIKVTETLGDFDFSVGEPPYSVTYSATGYVYFYQADDTTTPDDGLTCLVSADGRRYQIADSSALAISSVLAMQNAPPGSPAVGDAYVVDVSPSGAWVGHAKDIALYTKRGWVFGQAKPGDAVLNETTGQNIQLLAAGSWGSMATSITSGGVAPGQLLFWSALSVEAQQNAPPGSPGAGDGLYYLVGLAPTGAWSGKANKIATYDSTSTWVFLTPYDGAQIFNKASDAQLTWFDATGDWRPQWPIASVCQGRLTTQTGVPISTAARTAQATLYFTPFRGNAIALYVNGGWALRTFTEVSLSIAGFTASKNYDVFGYDNAGVLAIESLVWTDDTTRATAVVLQDGVKVKSGDATRRYLGTFYTTATGQTEDSELKRMHWNESNRVRRPLRRVDPTVSWNVATSGNTFRQANGNSANQVEFVLGAAEDEIELGLRVATSAATVGAQTRRVAIGLDAATAATACVFDGASGTGFANIGAMYADVIAAGRHRLIWLEDSGNTNTATFIGSSGLNGTFTG